MTKPNRWRRAFATLLLGTTTVITSAGQTFIPLVKFNGTDGANPYLMSLVQGMNGNFYGTTVDGGESDYGTVFEITPAGRLKTLYNFCANSGCADGAYPFGSLILAPDGSFYGTTEEGGSSNQGTVFKITPRGTLTTLHSFSGLDGSYPNAGLVQGINGNFYGTTLKGGEIGYGTVFTITPEGKLTTLYDFCSQPSCTDGQFPSAGLVQGTNGNFYGTTLNGGFGPKATSTLFEITPTGKLTTLYTFCSQPNCTDGLTPYGTLIQATNGNFYGTTVYGGIDGFGTIFEITPSGSFTTLYSFCSQPSCNGLGPFAGLIQATDGNFYGMASAGGGNDGGTLFELMSSGSTVTSYSLCFPNRCADGSGPTGAFLQATNGRFYGTNTYSGIDNSTCDEGCGTVFSFDIGLGPFVAFVQAFGKVGQTGGILGQGFTGTTSVMLNGIATNFTVVSDTFIRATVPPGATTGYVSVSTPNGVLTGNVPFHVIQ